MLVHILLLLVTARVAAATNLVVVVATNGTDQEACGPGEAPCRTLRYAVQSQALGAALSGSLPEVVVIGGPGAAGHFSEGNITFNFSMALTGVEVQGYSPVVDFLASTMGGGFLGLLPPNGTLLMNSMTITGGLLVTGTAPSGVPLNGGGALAVLCNGPCTLTLTNLLFANNSVTHAYGCTECTRNYSCGLCGARMGGGAVLVQDVGSNGSSLTTGTAWSPPASLKGVPQVVVDNCIFQSNSFVGE
jgi:hypothetical protein